MAAVSKAEYLKRYLSNTTEDEKKKKRKKKPKVPQKFARSTVVDDDVGWNDLAPKNDEAKAKETEFDDAGDEAPVVYDEDGVEAISLDSYKKREQDISSKWAPMNSSGTIQNKVSDSKQSDTPDNSPPRGRTADAPDNSPPIRSQRADTQDNSPPRRRMADTPDNSPQRTRRADTPDNSPPRRRRADTPDNSPPRRSQRADTPDNSPPRRSQRADTPNNSPPRRSRRDDTPDNSPPRRSQRADTPDNSPPRRSRRADTPDNSPPRRRRADCTLTQDKKAGLMSAEDLKKENALSRQREADMFATMDSSVSGRGAKTVHRDKSGRKRDLEAEAQKKKEEELQKAKDDEKFHEWGRGVAQTQAAKEKVEDYLHEANKPLARYKDDKDLDAMLKEQDRDDDPMLAYMQKKKASVTKKTGIKEKPRYKGPQPQPNRFSIPPGYRWDGVDRSNGFEKKRFAMLSNKKATETIAHKWSIEDM